MLTLHKWVIGTLIALLLIIGGGGYYGHTQVLKERDKVELNQLRANATLQSKYNQLSTEYNTLKAKKELVRTVTVTREDKLINEKPDYYAADCFDADSLQHIQASQRGD